VITGSFVVIAVSLAWGFFLLWMAYGRDVDEPLWTWLGIPATMIALILVGHFYYGMPIFDWSR